MLCLLRLCLLQELALDITYHGYPMMGISATLRRFVAAFPTSLTTLGLLCRIVFSGVPFEPTTNAEALGKLSALQRLEVVGAKPPLVSLVFVAPALTCLTYLKLLLNDTIEQEVLSLTALRRLKHLDIGRYARPEHFRFVELPPLSELTCLVLGGAFIEQWVRPALNFGDAPALEKLYLQLFDMEAFPAAWHLERASGLTSLHLFCGQTMVLPAELPAVRRSASTAQRVDSG